MKPSTTDPRATDPSTAEPRATDPSTTDARATDPSTAERRWRPTREELAAAAGKEVADVIGHDLQVLFCGINPGLYSGAVGHHFARPGNRFWKVLHLAGLTERELSPFEERELLGRGLGITNLVARATAAAAELTPAELRAGAAGLDAKVRRYRPAVVAFAGIGAYRSAFRRPRATVGPQPEAIGGARAWLLPNPSGLQARYQLGDLVRLFAAMAAAARSVPGSGREADR